MNAITFLANSKTVQRSENVAFLINKELNCYSMPRINKINFLIKNESNSASPFAHWESTNEFDWCDVEMNSLDQ